MKVALITVTTIIVAALIAFMGYWHTIKTLDVWYDDEARAVFAEDFMGNLWYYSEEGAE